VLDRSTPAASRSSKSAPAASTAGQLCRSTRAVPATLQPRRGDREPRRRRRCRRSRLATRCPTTAPRRRRRRIEQRRPRSARKRDAPASLRARRLVRAASGSARLLGRARARAGTADEVWTSNEVLEALGLDEVSARLVEEPEARLGLADPCEDGSVRACPEEPWYSWNASRTRIRLVAARQAECGSGSSARTVIARR
jgi:hypothetical protein